MRWSDAPRRRAWCSRGVSWGRTVRTRGHMNGERGRMLTAPGAGQSACGLFVILAGFRIDQIDARVTVNLTTAT